MTSAEQTIQPVTEPTGEQVGAARASTPAPVDAAGTVPLVPPEPRIHFTASHAPAAQDALAGVAEAYGQWPLEKADVLVALGGDGFMLTVLAAQLERVASGQAPVPVYGVNYGTLGFLMNRSLGQRRDGRLLPDRVVEADAVTLVPLRADALLADGSTWTRWAFNEVAVRRVGSQAACLRVSIDGRPRLDRLAGDGLLLATPAGSAAYNYSAGGPVLPLSANAHALTAICPIAPRRWPGAVLPASASVQVEVLERPKRPVGISADAHEVDDIVSVTMAADPTMGVVALYDADHDLDERLLAVQFDS